MFWMRDVRLYFRFEHQGKYVARVRIDSYLGLALLMFASKRIKKLQVGWEA